MSGGSAQRAISAWFDATYTRKGLRYLRPPRAYLVFPGLVGTAPSDRVLDVACGPGLLLEAAGAHTSRLHGCDLSRVAISQAQRRLPAAELLVANAEALPYDAGAFDVVTCLAALERMLDRPRALAEMLRVGAARARYCFLVRNSSAARWRYLSRTAARRPSRGHADADTVVNWRTLFEAAGFRVRRVLPDQYPLHRRRQWRSLFLGRVDFEEAVTNGAPLERSGELVFVLEKA